MEKIKTPAAALNGFIRNGIAADKESFNSSVSGTFPTEVFPAQVQSLINECQTHLKAVPDFMGCAALYAASIAIGNRFKVQVKGEYLQSALLYIVTVAPPNVGKSFPFDIALKPIEKIETWYSIENERANDAYKSELAAYEALPKDEKAKTPPPVEPKAKQILLQDATPEAVIQALSENPAGLGMFYDELSQWIQNFNRYSGKGEATMYIEIWNGKSQKRNRIGRGIVNAINPFLSIGGTTQPDKLKLITKSFVKDGFIDRFLFAMPYNLKKEMPPDTDVNPAVFINWHNTIKKIADIPANVKTEGKRLIIPDPRLMWVSSEAKQICRHFVQENTDLCNASENIPFAGIWGKLDMYVYRLAMIMELLQYACSTSQILPTEISGSAMQAAVKLCEYFREHGRRAITIIDEIDPLADLPKNEAQLFAALPAGTFGFTETLSIALKNGMPSDSTYYRVLKKWLDKGLLTCPKSGKYAKAF